MTAPLSQEERREIRHRADGAVTRRGQPSDDWAWMACMLAEDTLRLLADLDRAEAERDEARCELAMAERCRANGELEFWECRARMERAEAERDRWYQTVQNEVQRARADQQNAEADLQIEKQQHAIARAKLEDLQHEYLGGIELGMRATAEQQGRIVSLEARLARVVEWLSDPSAHAEDCPTRVDNLAPYMSRTQCLCHVAPLLAAAKGEP